MSDSVKNYSSDDESVSRDHKRLLQAVGSLSKVQHIKKVTRKEPSANQNEFDLIKPSAESLARAKNPVRVEDLAKTLKGTSNHLGVGKELKNVQSSGKALSKPLEKPEAERVVRAITYEKTKKQLQRWDALVAQMQVAETQTFPLDSETIYINTAKLKKPPPRSLKSELEIAFEEADAKFRALKGEKKEEFTKNDEKLEQMMLAKEEVKKRRQDLLYLKMRQSQQAAKLRLKNKIKSKKYHRMLKQQKLKEQLKEFELLQKQNPEEAMEKLKSLEKNRILERANLRHKNTGTWAKNNLVKARYNRDVQKDLSEQLALSRQLTEKKDVSDDEKEAKSDEDVPMDQGDPSNPWMQASGKKRALETVDTKGSYRKYWTTRNEDEEKLRKHRALLAEDSGIDEDEKDSPTTPVKPKKQKKAKKSIATAAVIENGWVVEDVPAVDAEANVQTIDKLFDKAEDNALKKFSKDQLRKKKELVREMKRNTKKAQSRRERNELKNLQDLSFKNTSMRPDIDEQLLETATGEEPVLPQPTGTPVPKESLTKDVIKHDSYADVKPKALKTSLMSQIADCGDDVDFDDEEDGIAIDRQATINDAFEDDDIVAEFENEKTADEKSALADQLVLSMPGWGSWAGTGIVERPKKELVLEFAKKDAAASKDGNKSRVRINETANKKLREHLVSDLPFPFTSVKDYEASIRAPIGRSFVTETAFQMLTKPAVITKKGQIITPMDESQLLKPTKRPRSIVEKRIMYDAKVAGK